MIGRMRFPRSDFCLCDERSDVYVQTVSWTCLSLPEKEGRIARRKRERKRTIAAASLAIRSGLLPLERSGRLSFIRAPLPRSLRDGKRSYFVRIVYQTPL